MKILYYSSSVIPSKFANSVHVMKMCHAMAKNNHDVVLFSVEPNENNKFVDVYDYYGVTNIFKVVGLRKRNIKIMGAVLYAIKVYRHTMSNYISSDFIYGRDLYCIYSIRKYKQFIYESHALPSRRIHYEIERQILKSSKMIKLVVISEKLKEDYLKMYPDLEEVNIVVAPDAADKPKIDEDISEFIKFKGDFNVGYIGHLYKGRGIDLVIELSKKNEDINFHVIGGTKTDIVYWEEQSKGISNIEFYGFIPNGELAKYYQNLDIVIAPYQCDLSSKGKIDTSKWMSPMKIFEYMSYRKPMVVSDMPVLREVLKDRNNCLLCKPDSLEEWSESIRLLKNDDSLRETISTNAYNDFFNYYTWEKRAKNIIDKV